MDVTFDLDMRQFQRSMRKLPIELEHKIANKALRAAASRLALEARKLAPVGDTGLLKRSIVVASSLTRRTRYLGVAVGIKKGTGRHDEAYYAHMVEFGTVHQSAQRFFTRAFNESRHRVLGRMSAKMSSEFRKLNLVAA